MRITITDITTTLNGKKYEVTLTIKDKVLMNGIIEKVSKLGTS